MFALDLFNTKYEKELNEGAVDNLTTRLLEPLSQRAADIRTKLRNGKISPAEMKALEQEYANLVAKRVDIIRGRAPAPQDECMGYGSLGEELSGDELNRRMAQVGKDASAGVAQSMNKQSDARIAALRNPAKPKSFMQQVGDKQIGMVKGAWKGLTNPNSVEETEVPAQQPRQKWSMDPKPENMPQGERQRPSYFEEGGIGQDLVTPQQRVKQSQPQKQTPAGKAVDTAKQAAKWLAGKGGPGREGPTYEATATAPRAFGVGNFQRLVKANMGNRPYVDLEFANPADNLKLDQAGLDLISDYYDGLETDQAKNHFIYRVLPSADEVKTILTKLGWTGAGQQQLPLAEKKKFNSGSDLEAGDVKVARELQKLRAQYPAAKSDVEAVAKAELDGTERSQQQLAAIKGANEKQDVLLKQLVSLDQEQGRELDDLDQENNTLEKRLARVQATNDRLQQTVSQIAATKKVDSKSDQTKTDTINKTNQDDEEDDVEPAIDLIPDAPVDNTPTPKAKPKVAPKKVYRKRKEKTSPGLGHMATQIAGLPKVAPDDTKTDTAIKDKEVDQEPSEPEDDVVQRPGSLKSLRPKVATNADDFKLVAEQQSKLSAGDPIIVTAPNEFEGATGEIHELSPSGKFVIVNLYNHGKHSMHLSDVEYNQYADDQDLDEGAVNPQFINAQVTKILAGEARRMTNAPMAQLLAPLMQEYNLTLQQIDTMVPGGLRKAAGEYGIMMKEGFQDFNKVEPYAVCLAGKPVKKFDYYEEARRFHDNWKQKLYREGNKEKADKITLMPLNLDESQLDEIDRRGFLKGLGAAALAGAGYNYATQPQVPNFNIKGELPKSPMGIYLVNYIWEIANSVSRYSSDSYFGKVAKQVGPLLDEYETMIGLLSQDNNPKTDALYSALLNARNKAIDDKNRLVLPALNNLDQNKKITQEDATKIKADLENKITRLQSLLSMKEAANPAQQAAIAIAKKEQGLDEDTGSWIVYDPETRQIKKRFKTHTAGKSYAKTHGLGFASSEFYFDRVKDNKEVAEVAPPGAKAERMVKHIKKSLSKDGKLSDKDKAIAYATTWKAHNAGKVEETQTDYQKRRQRERDVDAGRPVTRQPKNPQTDYARKRAKDRKDMELGEATPNRSGHNPLRDKEDYLDKRDHLHQQLNVPGLDKQDRDYIRQRLLDLEFAARKAGLNEESSTSSDAVERAILNRIMVAHTDLLMKFGPDKVMQAAEEVAYNVGDVDEIGRSDVNAYVDQVKQILGA